MSKPTQPEMFDFDGDSLRHPMWTPPADTERMGVHIRALRKEIAKQLIPMDGRSDCNVPINYCEAVYGMSTVQYASNFIWLLGQIEWLRIKAVRLLGQHKHPERHERDIKVLTRLCEDFAQAVTKEIA